jgi:hypothetical protein
MRKADATRRIVAGTLLAVGLLGLMVAGAFLVWLREWEPIGLVFAFWYVVVAVGFLAGGWAVLRWDIRAANDQRPSRRPSSRHGFERQEVQVANGRARSADRSHV